MSSRVLVLGLGVTGRASLEALARREIDILAVRGEQLRFWLFHPAIL